MGYIPFEHDNMVKVYGSDVLGAQQSKKDTKIVKLTEESMLKELYLEQNRPELHILVYNVC